MGHYTPEEVGDSMLEKDEGGYLIPSHIKIERGGVIARIARLFNISYGWESYPLADEFCRFADREDLIK